MISDTKPHIIEGEDGNSWCGSTTEYEKSWGTMARIHLRVPVGAETE